MSIQLLSEAVGTDRGAEIPSCLFWLMEKFKGSPKRGNLGWSREGNLENAWITVHFANPYSSVGVISVHI